MSRERILADVRRALARPRPSHPDRPSPPPPADDEPAAMPGPLGDILRERIEALGGRWHAVRDADEAATVIAGLEAESGPVWVARDPGAGWAPDRLAQAIERRGRRVVRESGDRSEADALAVGVTGVLLAIADSGTLALSTGPASGRLPSVLPPIHCAVLTADQIVPHLEAGLPGIGRSLAAGLTSGVILVSGPSKTGDIEGRLVVGVHGPRELHVIALPAQAARAGESSGSSGAG